MAEAEHQEAGALLLADAQASVPGAAGLLAGLKPADREAVRARGRLLHLQRGEVLFRQEERHEGVFLIESGLIRVFYSAPTGREVTLAYWMPGNFVGGPEVFGGGRHVWTGVAARRSTALALAGQELRSLILAIPDLGIGIIEGLVFKGKCYSAMAQLLGTRSASDRLILLLHSLSSIYGYPENGRLVIRAAFTHADLAHLVGATRQWVTISLKRLEDSGVLSLGRGRISILKPDALGLTPLALGNGHESAPAQAGL